MLVYYDAQCNVTPISPFSCRLIGINILLYAERYTILTPNVPSSFDPHTRYISGDTKLNANILDHLKTNNLHICISSKTQANLRLQFTNTLRACTRHRSNNSSSFLMKKCKPNCLLSEQSRKILRKKNSLFLKKIQGVTEIGALILTGNRTHQKEQLFYLPFCRKTMFNSTLK
jgi:hypothetical protein